MIFSDNPVLRQAIDWGIDVDLIAVNLSLTPQERIHRHQQALDMIDLLKQAVNESYEPSRKSSDSSD